MSHATLHRKTEVDLNTSEIILRKSPVNIRDLLIYFRDQHLHSLEIQNISMMLQTIPDKIIAMIDQEKVLQILNQFMENALKALPDGGYIDLKAYQQSNCVIISFIDNGLGIKEENLNKIKMGLTDFIIDNKMKLGVGLFISRWIAQAHGGKIMVESVERQGSIVSVCLPLENSQKD